MNEPDTQAPETEEEGIARIKAEILADPDDFARRVWLTRKLHRDPRYLRSLADAEEEARSGDLRVVSGEDFLAQLSHLQGGSSAND